MTVGIAELATTTFRTSRAADGICDDLTTKLGWRHRYVSARIAIARSLSLPDPPPPLSDEEMEDMATPIRGMQLFGDGATAAAWLALITQHAPDRSGTKKGFQSAVAQHWARGAALLQADWSEARSMEGFVARLAELASFSGADATRLRGAADVAPTIDSEVHLSVGEVARDTKTDEKVVFALNQAGGSPHMAIMGGVGSGKTRTAVHMLRELRRQGNVPLLAFDFKGDLADSLAEPYGATVVHPPEEAVPLDVLHVQSTGEDAIKTTAARIRDAIASIKSRRPSGIQSEALREAIATALRVTPSLISAIRAIPRYMTVLPGGGSLPRAR